MVVNDAGFGGGKLCRGGEAGFEVDGADIVLAIGSAAAGYDAEAAGVGQIASAHLDAVFGAGLEGHGGAEGEQVFGEVGDFDFEAGAGIVAEGGEAGEERGMGIVGSDVDDGGG
jgi:hypothetical protein